MSVFANMEEWDSGHVIINKFLVVRCGVLEQSSEVQLAASEFFSKAQIESQFAWIIYFNKDIIFTIT